MRNSTLTLFLGIALLFSCSKEKHQIAKSYQKLIGDYDWSYSIVDGNSGISKPDSDKYFGVRIREDGSVKLYQNGIQIADTDVSEYSSDGLKLWFTCKQYETSYSFEFDLQTQELTSVEFPLTAITNKFEKL